MWRGRRLYRVQLPCNPESERARDGQGDPRRQAAAEDMPGQPTGADRHRGGRGRTGQHPASAHGKTRPPRYAELQRLTAHSGRQLSS